MNNLRVQATPTPPQDPITVQGLWEATNRERASVGLQPLVLNADLNTSATNKCADMAQYNYWAHDNPNGTKWDSFITVPATTVAENLAQGYDTTTEVTQGWMNSPGHRASIVHTKYTDVGYGICEDEKLDIIVVQHFLDI